MENINMNSKERFKASLTFQPIDRPFHWETLGMWPETLDRWYAEGLDAQLKHPLSVDWGAIRSDEYLRVLVHAFEFDRVDYLRDAVVSGYNDSPFFPPFEQQVIQEEENTRIILDSDGITKREFSQYNTSSMPQFLKFPVENRQDFVDLLPRLNAYHPGRFSADYVLLCQKYRTRDFPAGLTVCGAFGHPRNLMGVENLCTAYYDQPALIHEILEQWLDFYCTLTSLVYKDLQFDFLLIWEDMAYKGGSLISPRLVKQFMLPYYQKLIDHVHSFGCDLIIVDSDGDVSELVPLFIKVGVNVMFPFEVQAGMDVMVFRRKYGKDLALIGGLDKRLLVNQNHRLVEEIKVKVLPLLEEGGYIPALDHTVPPDVSLKNFRNYLNLIRSFQYGD